MAAFSIVKDLDYKNKDLITSTGPNTTAYRGIKRTLQIIFSHPEHLASLRKAVVCPLRIAM